MEMWPDRSLTKFSRGKCKVLYSRWSNHRQHDRLGLTGQKTALQKNLHRSMMTLWQLLPWQQSKPATSQAVLTWVQLAGEGRHSSPWLGTGKTTSGHYVQFGLPSIRQTWIHQSKWSRSTQLVRGWDTEAEGGGLVQPGEGEAKGRLSCCLPLPNGMLQRGWCQPLLGDAQTQAGTWKNPTRYEWKRFHHDGS